MARLLQRLGLFSARSRKSVIAVWALLLIALGVITMSFSQFSDETSTIPGTESSQALETLEEKFPGAPEPLHGGTLQLVLQAPDDGEITGAADAAAARDLIAEVATVEGVTAVSNPFDPGDPYISPDGSTAIATVDVETGSEAALEEVQAQVREVADGSPALTAQVGGSMVDTSPKVFGLAEVIAAGVAFLVLLLAYGSLVAAGANMLMALIGVGVGLLGVLAASAFSPIQTTTPILALMLGLAVGIDYVLFIITRFRAELRKGRSVTEAIEVSSGTAGSSVVFAGATVVIALAGLSVVGISFLTEMGLAAAGAVSVAVLMALTLTPALLAVLGRRLLPKTERATTLREPASTDNSKLTGPVSSERITLLERWGSVVVRRPVACLTVALIGLAVIAVPALALKSALSVPGGDDPEGPERAAYQTVAEEFGPGAQSPLVVLAESDSVRSAIPAVLSMLEDTDGVVSVATPQVSSDGSAALFTVIADTDPLDAATTDLVSEIRDRGAALDGNAAGVDVRVTGQTAVDLDTNQKLSEAFVVYGLLVSALAVVLLIFLFRSILVPLVAALGFVFSLAGALGASVAVFQWGWFDFLVNAPQGDPISSLIPILLTGILFGLAMDYQVFLVSRMHEAHLRGLPPKEAVLDGFSHSAGVVVAAAAIMTAVFAGFGLSASPIVASIGLGLAVGVLLDAFVVRLVIVPATLSLLGDKAWWVPTWLDRLLPHIHLEGDDTVNLTDTPSAN
ncbi:MMPL family transporter [Nocardioides endophyticus]|uniref:MMPL family transporter n=1 Tax=Nocardioides endophyticus TaxID=1353775 RepID=A0ABP8YW86_9ACTN